MRTTYYPVKIGDAYGVIDARGNLVLAPQPHALDDFGAEEVAWFHDRSPETPFRLGLMHVSGRILVPPKYHAVEPFSEGFAWACTYDDPEDSSNRLWTVVDCAGREQFAPRRYRAVFDFNDGATWVDLWDHDDAPLHWVIDPAGRAIYKPANLKVYVGPPQEGLASFSVLQEEHPAYQKTGFLDRDGRIVIEPQFSDTGRFSEGRHAGCEGGEPGEYGVPRGGRLGFIDREGRWLFDVKAESVWDFSDGRAVCRIGKKYGFIDEKGNLVIPAVFDETNKGFSEGLAPVQVAGIWGVIDRQGAWRVEPRGLVEVRAIGFQQGLLQVFVNRSGQAVPGWIDGRGRWVFPPGVEAYHITERFHWSLMSLRDQYMNPVAYTDLNGRYVWPPEKRGQPVVSESTDSRDQAGLPAR